MQEIDKRLHNIGAELLLKVQLMKLESDFKRGLHTDSGYQSLVDYYVTIYKMSVV